MIRRWLPFAVGIGIVVWLAALVMLAMTAEGPQRFGELYLGILLVNVTGVIALLVLIGGRLADFVRDWRRHVPGSRLRGRTLLMFGGLAIAPLLLVFAFSVTFLTRGIDSWFHAEVRQGLTDALGLSRAALDLRMREYLDRTSRMAARLDGLEGSSLYLALDEELRSSGAEELIVTSAGGQSIAYSRAGMLHALPAVPPEELLLQLRQGRPHVSLQPAQGGGYQVLAATPIRAGPGAQGYLLVATYPVPQRLSDLAGTVQQAYQQYGQLSFLREPLKATFVLTLSLVLLMALLAAMYGALYFSERLVRPVQDLIAGTRAVAKGDFDTRLLRPSHDEIGFLVTSFNDMTKKLARAREENERSQAAVEAERAALAVILARLTSGVISLEPDLRVRVANQAAGTILGVDFADAAGRPLAEIAAGQPLLAELHEVLQRHVEAGETEWREQVTLRTETGRREFVCACTALPGDAGAQGLVLVFDEVTQLLQAQRQAAWGEVARRLAHEIRNPLTPIQLSAERMRRKLMRGLGAPEAELLDRSTHTIVQQVEAMKQMVAAFSEYAKAPGDARFRVRPRRADPAGLGPLPRAGPARRFRPLARPEGGPARGRSGAHPPAPEQPADELARGARRAGESCHHDRDAARGRPDRADRRRQRARLPGWPARAGVRSLRHLEAKGHGARPRHRAPDRRRARGAGRGRQRAARRREGTHDIAGGRA